MPEPERFTAPVSGRYHVVSGLPPHHEAECDDTCPMHPGYASKDIAVRGENTPAVRVIDIDVPAFIAAITEVWRNLCEALAPIVRAVVDAVRPLAALLEQYPELAQARQHPEPSGCHHLCGYGPAHQCLGEADGELAYEPGGHAIPMCAPCQAAADQHEPLRIRNTLDSTVLSGYANWPEQSATCAHVCGADPDHQCEVRATESLTYPLPSGGRRRIRLCAPCHASEMAEATQTSDPV